MTAFEIAWNLDVDHGLASRLRGQSWELIRPRTREALCRSSSGGTSRRERASAPELDHSIGEYFHRS